MRLEPGLRDGTEHRQLVLPSALTLMVLAIIHIDTGHPVLDRTLSLLKDSFFVYGVTRAVDAWIGNCDRYVKGKTPTDSRAPRASIESK